MYSNDAVGSGRSFGAVTITGTSYLISDSSQVVGPWPPPFCKAVAEVMKTVLGDGPDLPLNCQSFRITCSLRVNGALLFQDLIII